MKSILHFLVFAAGQCLVGIDAAISAVSLTYASLTA